MEVCTSLSWSKTFKFFKGEIFLGSLTGCHDVDGYGKKVDGYGKNVGSSIHFGQIGYK